MKKITFIIIILSFLTSSIFSQTTTLECGAIIPYHLNNTQNNIEEKILRIKKNSSALRSNATSTIPIVFHIVEDGSIIPPTNSSIIQLVKYLNDAFAGVGDFNSGINTNIQFCLAQRTPDGKATNGITKTSSIYANVDMEKTDENLKQIERWDTNDYINVWVVNSIKSNSSNTILGYAYYAGTHGSAIDGIVIRASTIDNTKEQAIVLVHEMGHYLNLYHTFEKGCFNDDCLVDGDKVCDTPPDQALHSGCIFNSCTTDSDDSSANNPFKSNVNDLTENFMDYSPYACYKGFTQGQSDRMNIALTHIRTSLLSSRGCFPPCSNPINININTTKIKYEDGETININNTSIGATTYQWLLNGQSISTQKDLSYTLTTLGKHTITLIASNNDNNCTEQKSINIEVFCRTQSAFQLSSNNVKISETITTNNQSTNANSYTWLLDGKILDTKKDISFTIGNIGQHNITLIATSANCSDTTSLVITTTCNHSTTLLSGKNTYKINDNIIITATTNTSNPSYTWSVNGYPLTATTNQINATSNQKGLYNYCVSVTDNNCTSVSCKEIFISDTDLCDVNYIKTYNNAENEQAKCIIKSPLGGYIIGGGRNNASLLLFTDDQFNVVDQIALELTKSIDIIYDLIIDSDNNLLAVGSYFPGSTVEVDFILKYDYLNKKVLWVRQIDEFGLQTILYNINQNPVNKNYFISGQVITAGGSGVDGLLGEINYIDGSTVWFKYYDMTDQIGDSETFNKTIIVDNNLYVASRYTYGSAPGFQGMRQAFSKFDLKGNENYSKYYIQPVSNDARLYLFDLLYNETNKSFYAVGCGDLNGVDLNNSATIQLLNIQKDGNLKWAKNYTIANSTEQRLYKILQVTDGFIMCAYFKKNGSKDIGFIKTDTLGNVQWAKALDYGGDEEIRTALINGDNIIFAGTSSSFSGNNDIYIGQFPISGTLISPCQKVTDISISVNILNTLTVEKSLQTIKSDYDNTVIQAQYLPKANYNNVKICSTSKVDLSIQSLEAICSKDSILSIQICNKGNNTFSEKVPITFFKKDPTKHSNNSIMTQKIDINLKTNECKTYQIKAPMSNSDYYYAILNIEEYNKNQILNLNDSDLNGLTSECIFSNNIDSFKINATTGMLNLGSNHTVCKNSIVKLSAGSGFKNYRWQDGSTDSTFTAYAPGVYSVTVLDICGNTLLGKITVTRSSEDINLGTDILTCINQTTIIGAPDGFNQYSWYKIDGSKICDNCQTISPTTTQKSIYYVIASKNNCISSDTIGVDVIAPQLNIGKDTIICEHDAINLNAPNGFDRYDWYKENNILVCNNCQNITAQIKNSTYYYVVAKKGHCTLADTLKIQVKKSDFSIGSNKELCLGDSIALESNIGLLSNIWKDSDNNLLCNNCSRIKIIAQGIKYIYAEGITQEGCKVNDTIFLSYKGDFYENIIDNKVICNKDSIILNINQISNIDWYEASKLICSNCPSIKLKPTQSTSYEIVGKRNNCIIKDTFNIKAVNLLFSLGGEQTICEDDTIRLSAPANLGTYVWKYSNKLDSCIGCNQFSISGINTIYKISLTIKNDNCEAENSVLIYPEDKAICEGCRKGKIYFPNIFSPNGDGTNDVFYPQSNSCDLIINQLSIYNRWGSLIFSKENMTLNEPTEGWDGTFLNIPCMEGVYCYFIQVNTPKGKKVTLKGDVMLIW